MTGARPVWLVLLAPLALAAACTSAPRAAPPASGAGPGHAPASEPVAVGPALRRGDREFAAGEFAAAVRAYEDVVAGHPGGAASERALFRLALIHSSPGSGAFDPQCARELALRLAGESEGAYHEEATLLLALLGAWAAGEERMAATDGELASLREQVAAAGESVRGREAALERLRARLADAEAELARVRTELEELKRIDLQRRP